MNDANGHPLAIGDIVYPDNSTDELRIDAFDGTLTTCRFKEAVGGAAFVFLPVHLIYISSPDLP